MNEPRETPALRESLRSLPAPAFVLFSGTFVNDVGSFVLPSFHAVPDPEGLLGASGRRRDHGLGELVGQITGGLLADRIGRRNAIALSMFSAGTLTLALWRAERLALIYP